MEEKILDELATLVLQQKIDIERYPQLKQDMEDFAYQQYESTQNHYEVKSMGTRKDLDNTVVDGYFQAHYFESLGQSWRPLGYLKKEYQQKEEEGLNEFLAPYCFASDQEKEDFDKELKHQILSILAYEGSGTIEEVVGEAYFRTMLLTGKDWVTDQQEVKKTYWKYAGKPVPLAEVYQMKLNTSVEKLTQDGLCTLLGDNGVKRDVDLTYEGRQYVYHPKR